ncbi:MAG: HepT-like ribonuclease domain-containing protein [Leptolyngbyaceae cyanobacterium bins.349]|nr:HepT-like ribonuclease domain-containing protein [Leptolyngbyaceae cyanobacterium bins.349]
MGHGTTRSPSPSARHCPHAERFVQPLISSSRNCYGQPNQQASIGKIERYTVNMTRETFVTDERTFDAVAHNLQVIGEAVKTIPIERRDRLAITLK